TNEKRNVMPHLPETCRQHRFSRQMYSPATHREKHNAFCAVLRSAIVRRASNRRYLHRVFQGAFTWGGPHEHGPEATISGGPQPIRKGVTTKNGFTDLL